MIPLGTVNNPVRRKPYLTYSLILINILVFLWELTLPQADLYQAFYTLALVPCEFTRTLAPEQFIDFFRSMFLHAGFWHLIGNMTYLWLFGTNVEDYLGRRWFLVLYFAGGLAAALVHTVLYPQVCVPLVGASGAIAAILGAYILAYPGTKVRAGIIFFRYFMFPVRVSAVIMLGVWFLLQVFNGVLSLGVDTLTGGGVAFFAHIGGFVFGAAFVFIFMMFNGPPPRDTEAA